MTRLLPLTSGASSLQVALADIPSSLPVAASAAILHARIYSRKTSPFSFDLPQGAACQPEALCHSFQESSPGSDDRPDTESN